MSIYTYVVDHEKEDPTIGADDVINGGKLKAVLFGDALAMIEETETFLKELRDETACVKTKYSLDDFMN